MLDSRQCDWILFLLKVKQDFRHYSVSCMKQNKRDTDETALKSATKAVENGKWWPCKRQLLVECEYCGYWRIAGHAIVSLLAKRFMVDLACSPHVLSGYSSFHTGWMDGGWWELFKWLLWLLPGCHGQLVSMLTCLQTTCQAVVEHKKVATSRT